MFQVIKSVGLVNKKKSITLEIALFGYEIEQILNFKKQMRGISLKGTIRPLLIDNAIFGRA